MCSTIEKVEQKQRERKKDPICSQLLNKLISGLDRRLEVGEINEAGYLSRATRGRLCEAETRILTEGKPRSQAGTEILNLSSCDS